MKNHAEQWLKYAEENRREQPGALRTVPMEGKTDYAQSLTCIGLALAHLSEAIPNRQVERSMAAAAAARVALTQLEEWLGHAKKEGDHAVA